MLEHLFREKMPFIHNHHQFPVLNAAHNFNLVVQQIPGVTSVKSCFTPQLFKQPIVEIPWRELGFGKIQDGVFLSIQGAFQAAQRGCFASARVANHKSKKLASGRVEKTVVNLLGILGGGGGGGGGVGEHIRAGRVIDHIHMLPSKVTPKSYRFPPKLITPLLSALRASQRRKALAISALSTKRGGMESVLKAISGVVPKALWGLEW